MIIIPAIDLKNGEAVRLYKGDYQQKTVYSSSPEMLAQAFENMGAMYLHVVDLDGAKDGMTTNIETIKKIRNTISIPIEVGGGIRDARTVSLYLDEIGINRVILGTAAIQNPDFLKAMLKQYGAQKIDILPYESLLPILQYYFFKSGKNYMENAHFMRAELQKLGLRVYGGENAPYLWVKTPNNTPSWKFFEEMLYGASVVCTPGVGFGPSGEGYIRLTAFGEHEDCKEAMERIAKWLGK